MDNFKNLYKLKDQVLTDAMDMIAIKILHRYEALGDKIYMFCGCTPGTGTTTLVINMAIAFAGSGRSVVVIDGDMRKSPEYKRLNGSVGLAEYLREDAELADIIHVTPETSMQYIPVGVPNEDFVRLLCSNRLKNLFTSLKDIYDFVLIDAPAVSAAVDAEIIAHQADATILVAEWNRTKKRQLKQAVEVISVDKKLMGVVLNRVNKGQYKLFNRDHRYFIDRQYKRAVKNLYSKNSHKKIVGK